MVKKFNMARINSSDRNVKASVENIKQQTYVNNIENKTKINEIIDEIDSNETSTASEIADIKDRLDTDEGNISTNTGDISDLGDALGDAMTYSTTESVVGKWINGKPIYRKVIDLGALPNSDSKIISTGLNVSDVNLIKLEGLAVGISGGNSFLLTLPDVLPAYPGNSTRLSGNSENGIWRVIVNTGIDRTNYTGYAFIYYTKTTD